MNSPVTHRWIPPDGRLRRIDHTIVHVERSNGWNQRTKHTGNYPEYGSHFIQINEIMGEPLPDMGPGSVNYATAHTTNFEIVKESEHYNYRTGCRWMERWYQQRD